MLTGRLRTGRWALHNGRIGIVNRFTDNDTVEFHLVDSKGETVGVETVPLAQLDTPTREHIPAARLTDVHPDWAPGQPVKFVEGVSARSDDVPSGRHSLEFVDDATLANWPALPATGDVPEAVKAERARRGLR